MFQNSGNRNDVMGREARLNRAAAFRRQLAIDDPFRGVGWGWSALDEVIECTLFAEAFSETQPTIRPEALGGTAPPGADQAPARATEP